MKHLDFFKRCGSARLWCLLALVALTANVAKADLIFSESFDYTAGQLSVGRAAVCNDSTKWWSMKSWAADAAAPTNPIMVTEGSLSYAGYVTTGTGNKAQLNTIAGTADVRRFKEVKTGSIFAAAIINMTSATSSNDYFFGVCDGTTNYYGRVYAKQATDGFQLGIAKYTEAKASINYTSTLNYNTNYLIVVEYVVKEGTKNDSVNLWVNPTKSTTTPTLVCDMTLANAKGDVSKIAGVYLFQSANSPVVAVDEIKVATAWADLFESGSTPEPSTTPTIKPSLTELKFGNLYKDATSELKFTVSGENLTGDITLASSSTEVVLDKTTIAQADAASGVEVTATLTASTAGSQTATITLSSAGATDVMVTASWQAIEVTKVANIAALKAAIAADGENYTSFQCTGEAVVTYTEKIGTYRTPVFYIEDATGAVRIDDRSGASMISLNIGDKIKDFIAYLGDEAGLSGQPLTWGAVPTVVSSGNDWTPQVVTLKELQDNHDDYLMELVKVVNVTLDLTEPNYIAGNNAISQDETLAAINLTSDNSLVGSAKPAYADIVGISYYTTGYNIRVRKAADIVAKSSPVTGLCRPAEAGQPLCYAADGQLHIEGATGEVAIYNLTGICVAKTTVAEQATIALPQGVYAVKVAGSTHKVVVSSK